ncbi:MAG: TrmH family RNA methyltransferase [Muribaculaceae bacterium]|nr:TrmH family RNA methyltransferase [Muribaculaceae bacterium]
MPEKKNILELTRISLDEYRRMEKLPFRLMADNVRSGQNIGAMLRTSDAMKVREVIMAGISPVPPGSEISKTALGAEDSVSWRYVEDGVEEVRRLKAAGVRIYVLEQAHGSVALQRLPEVAVPHEEVLIVAGNEVNGVDQRIVDLADVILEIPMEGIKHSLNVSVSVGLVLWEFYKLYLP